MQLWKDFSALALSQNLLPGGQGAEVDEAVAPRFLVQVIQLGLVENRGPGTGMELGSGWTPR